MPIFQISDFKEGLDVRRTALTAPAGTCRILQNAVLNQGGEVEKRFAFVNVTTLPAGCSGLFGQGAALNVFGFAAGVVVPPGTSPVPITYHLLAAAPTGPITIVDVEAYADKFYVLGQDPNGVTYAWYDGVLVLDTSGNPIHGSYARTYKTKMYRADGPYLRFSGVNSPGVEDPASTANPGAGFINAALNDPDGEPLQGLEVYYNQMAVMARLQVQLWTMDPDPTLNNLMQILRIGTVAPRSIVQFGTGDVLFLSDSGVRSLRAMNINLAAAVSDVGSAVDLLLVPLIRSNPTAVANAHATIQPIQGRYWLFIADTIYVLSYFPAGNITAWSTFVPGFTIDRFAVVTNQVYCSDTSGNVYLYGGLDGQTYDSCQVQIRTPHHAVGEPTQRKLVQSVDMMCQGAWSVSIGMLPNNLDAFELCANVVDNTYGLQSIPFAGYGTHIGLDLINAAPGPALLGQISLNIQEGARK